MQLDSLSPEDHLAAYKHLQTRYIREDAVKHAKEIGIELTDQEIDDIVHKFVYDNEHDPELSHWINIDNLIYNVHIQYIHGRNSEQKG